MPRCFLGISGLLLTFLILFAYLEISLESRYYEYATQTRNRRVLRDNNMAYIYKELMFTEMRAMQITYMVRNCINERKRRFMHEARAYA